MWDRVSRVWGRGVWCGEAALTKVWGRGGMRTDPRSSKNNRGTWVGEGGPGPGDPRGGGGTRQLLSDIWGDGLAIRGFWLTYSPTLKPTHPPAGYPEKGGGGGHRAMFEGKKIHFSLHMIVEQMYVGPVVVAVV